MTHLTLQTLRDEDGKKKKKEPHPYLSDVFEYKLGKLLKHVIVFFSMIIFFNLNDLAHSDQIFRPVNIDKNKAYFKYSEK